MKTEYRSLQESDRRLALFFYLKVIKEGLELNPY